MKERASSQGRLVQRSASQRWYVAVDARCCLTFSLYTSVLQDLGVVVCCLLNWVQLTMNLPCTVLAAVVNSVERGKEK